MTAQKLFDVFRNSGLALIVMLGLCTAFAIGAEAEERRAALVIGVADYTTATDLKNTVNDSNLMGNTLEKLDFEVTRLQNPTLAELRAALDKFAFEAETADVALVYFAGHGIEFGGQNLLLPADVAPKNRSEVAQQSVSLDDVLAAVDKARQLRIVILDSCRDDPFLNPDGSGQITLQVEGDPNAAASGGLAKPSPDRGTLVAFAAEAGAVAFDGEAENSPYALALSRNLQKENLEIGLVFRSVRDDVLRTTFNFQEPHTYGSLSGNPYFLAGETAASNTVADRDDRKTFWAALKSDDEQQLLALANIGDTRALKGLAYMRLNPESDRFEPSRAVELLQKAAEEGDPEAQFELGRLYERGIGVPQDVDKATELYWKAADQDFADAINDLGFLHFQGGLNIVRDPRKAIELFQRAADLRHPEAMFNIAALIDDGDVPGRSPDDAARYLYDALRSGNQDVLNLLSEQPRMFKQSTRRALQLVLSEKDFYEGAIDADFGPGTQRGLRRAYGIEE
ncbi:MAG: caspase family protein [Pseudomonadota bacterium]